MVQAIANLTEGQRALLGPHRGHVRWIRDQLRAYNGVQPNAAAIANIRITGDDLVTDAGDQFLLGDNVGVPEQNRVIGFATRTSLLLLRGASTWLVDGTFSVAPAGFAQLWVVHAQVGVQTLPLAFFLMERRTQEDYVIALGMIRRQLDILPAPNAPVAAATRGRPRVNQPIPENAAAPFTPSPFFSTLSLLRPTRLLTDLAPMSPAKAVFSTSGRPSCAG